MAGKILSRLDQAARIIRRISNSMLYIGIVLLGVITVTSMYGVLQRLLGAPVSWAIELNELLQVAFAFLPAAYVLNMDKHVRMELLDTLLRERGRRFARAAFSTVGAALTGLLAYSTATAAQSSVRMEEATVIAALPIYPFKICVTVGFALLAVQFAAHVWECLRNSPECVPATDQSDSYL